MSSFGLIEENMELSHIHLAVQKFKCEFENIFVSLWLSKTMAAFCLSRLNFPCFQECKFHVGSYIHDATQIHFTGTFGHDTVNQRAQQYEINITALDEADTTVVWANRNYSQTGFKV